VAVDTVVRDLSVVLTMDPALGEGPLGERRDAAVAFEDGVVTWVGDSADAPDAPVVHHLPGCVALPALVDCHTHAVWAGSRADEFLRRLRGESYTSILEGGGGILSTVRATRATPEAELVRLAAARLQRLAAYGVGTVEVKSGYGLDPETERRMLVVARLAAEWADVRVVRTFLGAHAIPAEWRHDRDGYVRQIIEEQLPRCAPEADGIDAYVDRGAFTLEEGERVLRAGQALGLQVRVHAEQVAHTGIAALAANLGALSCDHLERVDDAGIAAMAAAGTVAVLLPAAMVYLRDTPPPVAKLREAGVPFAVATDLNPGSSPVHDPWTCATLACLTMGLTVEEALLGLTRGGARALGRPRAGHLSPGAAPGLAVFEPAPGEPPSAASLVQVMSGHRLALRLAPPA
jgi:imidazolonepropionase